MVGCLNIQGTMLHNGTVDKIRHGKTTGISSQDVAHVGDGDSRRGRGVISSDAITDAVIGTIVGHSVLLTRKGNFGGAVGDQWFV